LGLGRPSYIHTENHNVPLPTLSNFSHLSLHSNPMSITPALNFIAMSHLSLILSDILSTFYTLKSIDRVKSMPISMLFSIMEDFRTRLHAFYDQELCQLYNVNNTLIDSSGTVILSFYTVEVVLYRAVLRCLPMEERGYTHVRGLAKKTLLNVLGFLEKLNVSRLRAFWWSRKFFSFPRTLLAPSN